MNDNNDQNNIIEFPKELSELRNSINSQLKLSIPDVSYSKIITGDWSYTCPSCSDKISFSSTNMIFRSIDIYCGSCGHLHRVANPAFSTSTSKKTR